MMDVKNDSMIRIRRVTKDRINANKIVRMETQDEVLTRALDALERERRDQASEGVRRVG